MIYACTVYGINEIYSSDYIVSGSSCDPIETELYTLAKLNNIDNIATFPEFENGEEFKNQINAMSDNSFLTMLECVEWANNNNVLLFYQQKQMTTDWCPDV